MGVRSLSKGEKVAVQLRKAFPSSIITVLLLDMASNDSIHAFVDQCATLPRIDIVILNAGIGATKYELSSSGHESTM